MTFFAKHQPMLFPALWALLLLCAAVGRLRA
jgi:hypothetical protein